MALTKLEEDLLRRLLTKNVDLNGRRIINAGDSQDDKDYVTQAQFLELEERVLELEKKVDNL